MVTLSYIFRSGLTGQSGWRSLERLQSEGLALADMRGHFQEGALMWPADWCWLISSSPSGPSRSLPERLYSVMQQKLQSLLWPGFRNHTQLLPQHSPASPGDSGTPASLGLSWRLASRNTRSASDTASVCWISFDFWGNSSNTRWNLVLWET